MDEYTADSRFEQARELLENELDLEAEKAFTELIDMYPQWEGAYGNRGLARLHLGLDLEAYSDFNKVAELCPDDSMAYSRMSEALRNVGEYQKALENAVKALNINPYDPDAHYVRGWLFFYFGQYAAAMEDLADFVDVTEDASEVEDMLDLCEEFVQMENLSPENEESKLRENGFSRDFSYNENFIAEGLFCPYAHCVRLFPCRGPQSPDVCMATGFACPGGSEISASCVQSQIDGLEDI